MGVHSFPTPLGTCRLSWNERGLSGFELPGGESAAPDGGGPPPRWVGELADRAALHLAGQPQDFRDAPLDWSRVTEFQRSVYVATQSVPAGATTTYGDIARAAGLGPEAARGVGSALGANPWPLLVPCHRVVAGDGRMTGFSAPGGVRTKTRLLVIEGAELLSD